MAIKPEKNSKYYRKCSKNFAADSTKAQWKVKEEKDVYFIYLFSLDLINGMLCILWYLGKTAHTFQFSAMWIYSVNNPPFIQWYNSMIFLDKTSFCRLNLKCSCWILFPWMFSTILTYRHNDEKEIIFSLLKILN